MTNDEERMVFLCFPMGTYQQVPLVCGRCGSLVSSDWSTVPPDYKHNAFQQHAVWHLFIEPAAPEEA